MLLFDTSAIIELIKGNQKLEKYLDEQVAVSTITVHELYFGANKSKNSQENIKIVREVLENITIVDVSTSISIIAAQIRTKLAKKGKEKPLADIIIGATAVDEGLELITFDHDFDEIQRNSDLRVTML